MPSQRVWVWLVAGNLLSCCIPAAGEIAVSASPPRTDVSLTIYGNTDLTVVRETRRVQLAEGRTELVLEWPGTAVDASSVRLAAPADVAVSTSSQPPKKKDQVRWVLQTTKAGVRDIYVTYFTSGIEWKPYYRLFVNEGTGTVELEGLVSLRNRSGQGFEDVEVRLVVGELRLVANLAEAAWKALPEYKGEKKERPPAASSGLSERHVYDLGRVPDLPLEDTVPIPLLPRLEIKPDLVYRFHQAKYGEKVHKFIIFENSPDYGLGELPLPRAEAYVAEVGTSGPLPRGKATIPYTPIGEECEIDLGVTEDVVAERRVVERRRTNFEFDRFGKVEGYDDRETVEVEISNWSPHSVRVEYTDTVPGVWDVASDEPYTEEGINEVIFELDLEPQTTRYLHYRLIKRQGRRVRLGPTRPK